MRPPDDLRKGNEAKTAAATYHSGNGTPTMDRCSFRRIAGYVSSRFGSTARMAQESKKASGSNRDVALERTAPRLDGFAPGKS